METSQNGENGRNVQMNVLQGEGIALEIVLIPLQSTLENASGKVKIQNFATNTLVTVSFSIFKFFCIAVFKRIRCRNDVH